MLLFHSGDHSVDVQIGDRFRLFDDSEWEVIAFASDRTYSPSGLGGTPIVLCRHIQGAVSRVRAESMVGGIARLCGDSVAQGVALTRSTNPYRCNPAPTRLSSSSPTNS